MKGVHGTDRVEGTSGCLTLTVTISRVLTGTMCPRRIMLSFAA